MTDKMNRPEYSNRMSGDLPKKETLPDSSPKSEYPAAVSDRQHISRPETNIEENIKICSKNIDELRGIGKGLTERLAAHIRELASAIAQAAELRSRPVNSIPPRTVFSNKSTAYDDENENGGSESTYLTAEDLRQIYNEYCLFSSGSYVSHIYTEAADPLESMISDAQNFSVIIYRVMLCSELCSSMSTHALESLTPEGLLGAIISPAHGISVAYLQNSYSDEAFSAFSEYLCRADSKDDIPDRILCDDLASVCEAVENGSAAYCILPIENISDGRLSGVRRLLFRYDLRIAQTVTLRESGMVFALLRKNLGRIAAAKEGPIFYEFSLSDSQKTRLGEILHAAEFLGLSVHKIDSVLLSHSSAGCVYDILLSCRDNISAAHRLSCFILYLILEAPDFSPIGIYRNTERSGQDRFSDNNK